MSTKTFWTWVVLLWPLMLGVFLCVYVFALQTITICPKTDYWPPQCPVMGVDLTAHIGVVITMLFYTYLFYVLVIGIIFGIFRLIKRMPLIAMLKMRGQQ